MLGNVFVYGSVALARTKLAKETEPEENPQDFPSTHKLAIDYTRLKFVFH